MSHMLGKQAKILAPRDVTDLLAFADCSRHPLRNRVIVMLSAKAGLRAGEIAGLTWDRCWTQAVRLVSPSSCVITRPRRAVVGWFRCTAVTLKVRNPSTPDSLPCAAIETAASAAGQRHHA
jgi:hypothetical protein